MKCLIINPVFADLILKGQKDWEIRTKNCHIRERIAIGYLGKVRGYATITNSIALNYSTLDCQEHHHRATKFLDKYSKGGKKQLYAWVLKDSEVEPFPYPYSFSTGSWAKAERPCFHCSPCLLTNQNDCSVIHPKIYDEKGFLVSSVQLNKEEKQ